MGKIVFLPLDERPCNYIYPEYIAKISGSEIEIVPRRLMGKFKQPADVEGIWEWTKEKTENDGVLIVSMDLFYTEESCPQGSMIFQKTSARNGRKG